MFSYYNYRHFWAALDLCDGSDQPLVVVWRKTKSPVRFWAQHPDFCSAWGVLLPDLITVWLWHCHTGRSTNFWLHTPPPFPCHLCLSLFSDFSSLWFPSSHFCYYININALTRLVWYWAEEKNAKREKKVICL